MRKLIVALILVALVGCKKEKTDEEKAKEAVQEALGSAAAAEKAAGDMASEATKSALGNAQTAVDNAKTAADTAKAATVGSSASSVGCSSAARDSPITMAPPAAAAPRFPQPGCRMRQIPMPTATRPPSASHTG